MAILFLLIGVALIVSAVRNTTGDLGSLVTQSFTGQGGFLYWIIVLVIIGLAGYVPALQRPSRWFLALVVLSYLLKNGGFFSQLTSALSSASPVAAPTTENDQSPINSAVVAPTSGIPITLGTGGSASNTGQALGAAGSLLNLGGLL